MTCGVIYLSQIYLPNYAKTNCTTLWYTLLDNRRTYQTILARDVPFCEIHWPDIRDVGIYDIIDQQRLIRFGLVKETIQRDVSFTHQN